MARRIGARAAWDRAAAEAPVNRRGFLLPENKCNEGGCIPVPVVYAMAMVTVKLPTFKCQVCGHEWHPRKPEKPLRCGRCKTPYWDRKREEVKATD